MCSDHFVSGSPSALFDENNPDRAPSLNLGYDSESMDSIEAKSGRYERAVGRSRKRAIDELDVDPEIPEADDETADEGNSISTQTDLSMKDLDAFDYMAY